MGCLGIKRAGTIIAVIIFAVGLAAQTRPPAAHRPLRVINGYLYDFSPAIQAHNNGQSARIYVVQGPVIQRFRYGSHITQFLGWEVDPYFNPSGGPRDILEAIVVERMASKGPISTGNYMALAPSLANRFRPAERQVFVRNLPTNALDHVTCFALPAGSYTFLARDGKEYQIPAYDYGTPVDTTAGFTNIARVFPTGLRTETIPLVPGTNIITVPLAPDQQLPSTDIKRLSRPRNP